MAKTVGNISVYIGPSVLQASDDLEADIIDFFEITKNILRFTIYAEFRCSLPNVRHINKLLLRSW